MKPTMFFKISRLSGSFVDLFPMFTPFMAASLISGGWRWKCARQHLLLVFDNKLQNMAVFWGDEINMLKSCDEKGILSMAGLTQKVKCKWIPPFWFVFLDVFLLWLSRHSIRTLIFNGEEWDLQTIHLLSDRRTNFREYIFEKHNNYRIIQKSPWQQILQLYSERGRLNRARNRVDICLPQSRLKIMPLPSIPFYLFSKSFFQFHIVQYGRNRINQSCNLWTSGRCAVRSFGPTFISFLPDFSLFLSFR
jgi:hypothetical protein